VCTAAGRRGAGRPAAWRGHGCGSRRRGFRHRRCRVPAGVPDADTGRAHAAGTPFRHRPERSPPCAGMSPKLWGDGATTGALHLGKWRADPWPHVRPACAWT